ncbi:DUF2855 family protein [Amycolatopsis sp. NBC_01307]|uniref:DUF2855 family protein n=1 Tax=Amycolatopsis sp. NBC_01307 TaxID=2903561 RepID=UPI002E0F9E69|nr:DUF2855 family protein [Amycolatopsis sp. NBC_01307]
MSTVDNWQLWVRRADLTVSGPRAAAHPALAPGAVRLEVEKFALTMNVVTYARLGDQTLPYWNAFPAPAGYGRVPVWAFVRVIDSRNPAIPVGGRYFGFVPIGTHHTVEALPTSRGFEDADPDRAFMPAWYRTFQPAAEPDDLDDLRAVFRPIFPASFTLAAFVAGLAADGIKSALITSASSRTAIGLAHLLARDTGLPAAGLTSAANHGFAAGTGCYGSVARYDEPAAVSVLAPAVLVDLTGSHRVITDVHERFAGALGHVALVGFTHPDSQQHGPALTDPKPQFFFAPWAEKRMVADEGESRFYARYHEAEQRFLESATAWLTIRRQQGPEAIAKAFGALLAGTVPAGVTDVLSP